VSFTIRIKQKPAAMVAEKDEEINMSSIEVVLLGYSLTVTILSLLRLSMVIVSEGGLILNKGARTS